MLILVDPHSGVPVYRQVMDQIKFHISSGLLKAGDELPSTRSLSSQLGVNPMTISKAYSYLEKDQVVQRRRGRPLIVRPFGLDKTRELKHEQLRESLMESVRIVRQLNIDDAEAVAVFRELLKQAMES